MQDSEQLAQIAYETYLNYPRRVTWAWPKWDRCTQEEQDAWISAAQAVKANVLGDFTKVGEGEAP